MDALWQTLAAGGPVVALDTLEPDAEGRIVLPSEG